VKQYDVHEARTHLSRLIERAAAGESFVIAKAGRPLVRVIPHDAPEPAERRALGFLPDIRVPDDFDEMAADTVAALFEVG
jgi:prevent-host-death family protein